MLALIVTHGWPGSIIEQMKIIGGHSGETEILCNHP